MEQSVLTTKPVFAAAISRRGSDGSTAAGQIFDREMTSLKFFETELPTDSPGISI